MVKELFFENLSDFSIAPKKKNAYILIVIYKAKTRGNMITIRGKHFTDSEIDLIQQIISANPGMSRRGLSILISQHLEWRQPNGSLKDRACRDVLLRLAQKGMIDLPEPVYTFSSQTAGVKEVDFVEPAQIISGETGDFPRPVFKIVADSVSRKLWNYLVDKYHYKGCRIVVGRHLKYLVYLEQELIACFGFADAVLHLNSRDHWLGWNRQQRAANLHLLINNVRFLILPWVKIRNLASKLLSLSAQIVADDWQRYYHYRPLLIETFVEKQRFRGTSYKAANWIYLGQTTGLGRSGMKYYAHGIIKDVYVYPLTRLSDLKRQLL